MEDPEFEDSIRALLDKAVVFLEFGAMDIDFGQNFEFMGSIPGGWILWIY